MGLLSVGASRAQDTKDDDIVVVTGKVIDQKSNKSLNNVSIYIPNTNIGTVSNADGVFTLKINRSIIKSGLKAEYPGYHSSVIDAKMISDAANRYVTISMLSSARTLKEVVVRSGNPMEIVCAALKKIPDNYSADKNLFSAFYRETIQKGKRFVGVSEAVLDVYKTPYSRRITYGDKVQVMKGRKLLSQKSSDTLAVKIVGGPTLPIILDFVKNEDFLFSESELDFYEFKMEHPTSIDDKLQYVIYFKPKAKVDYALCEGKLFIDQETLSFSRAEFSVDMSDKDKATKAILRKKPRGLHFKPQEISFVISYKDYNGKTYLNYVSSKSRFKCDWKKRLFSSGYTTYTEMVMVDRIDNPSAGISGKFAFSKNDIFDDKVGNYWDVDFWKDYNIIEPTESLEKAVDRLKYNGGQQSSLTNPVGHDGYVSMNDKRSFQ